MSSFSLCFSVKGNSCVLTLYRKHSADYSVTVKQAGSFNLRYSANFLVRPEQVEGQPVHGSTSSPGTGLLITLGQLNDPG
jgi:hypothetical protein